MSNPVTTNGHANRVKDVNELSPCLREEHSEIIEGYRFPTDARMITETLVNLFEGEDTEPMEAVESYRIDKKVDGSVEIIVGLNYNTSLPTHYVKIKIERVED